MLYVVGYLGVAFTRPRLPGPRREAPPPQAAMAARARVRESGKHWPTLSRKAENRQTASERL